MKKILMICLLCFSICVMSQAKGGTYYNTNSNTNDIKRVRITKNSQTGQQFIRIYAACGKGECYWGRFKINEYTGYDYLERQRFLPTGASWFGSYKSFTIDQGFVKRKVYLAKNLRNSDHIRLTVESDYKDPKRTDRKTRNILKLK